MNDNKEILTSDNVNTNQNKKKDRPQNKNLVSLANRTMEERREIGRKGGLKNGERLRARKNARELLSDILAQNMTDTQIEEILGSASDLLGDNKTAYNVMMVKALQVAMTGDVKGLAFVRDTVGDAPVNKQETNVSITDSDKALIDTVRQRLLG